MSYRITYMFRATKQDVELNRCENVLDALYKFYDDHGMCDIVIIEQV